MEEQTNQIEVTDLGHFIALLSDWHSKKADMLRHFLDIPVGTEISIDDETHRIDGDFRKGFIAGLVVALTELGTLPFQTEYVTEADEALEA